MRASGVTRLALCALLAVSLVTVAPPGVAQAGGSSWHWLSPLPRGETLNAVDLVTTDIGYAVGNMGCLMKTYDGGANWINKSSGTTEDLEAVFFIDSDTGWAGGDNGVILKTDGTSGATWVKQATGVTDGSVTDLFFLDANRGWAADQAGRIFRTADGGATWTYASVLGADFTSVWFVSTTTGFATSMSAGTLYKTTDGGANWDPVLVAGAPLMDIAFKPGDPQIGWITVWRDGDDVGSAYRTADGGANWTPVNIGGNENAYLQAVAWAPDGSAVWMTGDWSQPRKIFTFADAAAPTVTALEYAPQYHDFQLNDVDCVSATRVLAVGAYGTIVRTTNGVDFLDRARVLPKEWINAIQFLDLRTGYIAASDGKVYKSTNAGTTWSATPTGRTEPMLALHFIDRNTGWAVSQAGAIIKTTNGGASWVAQNSGVALALRSVCFTDANTGWVAGDEGTMLHTTNGGATWVPQGVGTFGLSALLDVDFYNANEGAAVGRDRVVYTTTNGGTNWTLRTWGASVGYEWRDVEYVAPNTFYVGGDWAELPTTAFSLIKTTTGGTGYSQTPLDQSAISDWRGHGSIYDMEFLDANNGWVAFQDGTIAKTADGGTAWTYEKVGDEQLESIDVVNAGAIWAGGMGGRLLSTYWYSPKTVYRFFNKVNGTHFYTASVTEKHNIIDTLSHIYEFEGVAYTYDDYYAAATLHRFYRSSTGSHFYTSSEAEKASVIANLSGVYAYEGPAYRVSQSPVGARTVWRFYMPSTGAHFYTASVTEKNNVIATLSHVYQYEGLSYYLPQ